MSLFTEHEIDQDGVLTLQGLADDGAPGRDIRAGDGHRLPAVQLGELGTSPEAPPRRIQGCGS